jgi:hypothetical protein
MIGKKKEKRIQGIQRNSGDGRQWPWGNKKIKRAKGGMELAN